MDSTIQARHEEHLTSGQLRRKTDAEAGRVGDGRQALRTQPSGLLRRPFDAATSGSGLRAFAGSAAERMLLARLEVTGAQRGARMLLQQSDGCGLAASIPHHLLRVRSGLQEGVAVGEPSDPLGSVLDMAVAAEADLFQCTRLVEGEPERHGPMPVYQGRRWTALCATTRVREVLALAPSYDAMLARLGRHTRRNIRAARRAAETARFRFEASTDPYPVSAPVLQALAARTQPYALTKRRMTRLEAYANGTGRPLRTMLWAPDGTLVSYTCGHVGDKAAAYLVYQLNDRGWHDIGPSLLHRSFLIERLIEADYRELIFVHGCSGILRNSCSPTYLRQFLLVRRSGWGYLSAAVVAACKPGGVIGQCAQAAIASEFGRARAR